MLFKINNTVFLLLMKVWFLNSNSSGDVMRKEEIENNYAKYMIKYIMI